MLPSLRTIGVAALTAGALAAAAAPASAGHSRTAGPTFATATGSDVVVFNAKGRAAQLDLRGIGYGEKIRGLDVRPSTGVLYAVTDADRVYTIDLKARRATPTGPAFMPPTLGEYGGFDFNPVPDKIRLTTDANENRRIEPANGATLAIDKPLMFAATDANMAVDPAVVGFAYTNPDNDPATGTTLYGIDAASDSLVKQDPPNDGVLTTVGKLGVNVGFLQGRLRHRPRQHRLGAAAPARRQARPLLGGHQYRRHQAGAQLPLGPQAERPRRPRLLTRSRLGRPPRGGPAGGVRSPRSACSSPAGFVQRAGGARARPNDHGCPMSAQRAAADWVRGRDSRETRLELAQRIANAYGVVLILILITFVVMMTLPPEGWGGRVSAVAVAGLTAIVAFTSSDVRPGRVRLAAVVAVAAVVVAIIAERIPSERLLGVAFSAVSILLAIAAGTILRRVIFGARHVDFRTILGAVSVYALLGLLFAFFFFAVGRWTDSDFFTGVAEARSSDYLFFSYTTLTTTGYGNLIPAGTVGQSFAVFEMLVGQIFLVTLVAGLVSLWRPGPGRPRSAGPRPDEPGARRRLRERFRLQRLELLLRDRAGVEQLLGLRDLGSGPSARRVAHIIVELPPLGLRLLDAALAHPVMLDDQIHQHPQPRQDHNEDHPERLGEASDVVTTKNIDQHGDHDPDPDHPEKEDDHRPQHVHKRIVSRHHHRCESSSITSEYSANTRPSIG